MIVKMLKRFIIGPVLLSIIFEFGCIKKPELNIEELKIKIPNEWSIPIHSDNDITGEWWVAFNNQELNNFLSQIKNESPDFLSLIQNQKIGLFNSKISGASLFPSLNLGFNRSESVQNLSAFGFADDFLDPRGTDTSAQVKNSGNSVLTFDNTAYGLGLNHQWELDVWGRLLNEREAAKKDYQALRYDISYIGFSLLVRSTILYYQAVEAMAQLDLSEESYESLVEIRDLVKNRYEKGLRSSLDYRLSETSVSTAILEMENRKNQLVAINRQLQVLTGEYPSGNFIKENKLPKYLPPIPSSIPAAIIDRRPDIRSLILKIESNSHRIAQAKRNLLPGIMLTGSLGTSTQDIEKILNEDFGIWNLGLGVTAPIFNGQRLRSAIKIQEASFEKSKQDLIKGLLQAFSEIEQYMYYDQSLVIQMNALESAVEQSRDAYNLSKERYDKGVTTLESVLNSQRQYNSIQSQYLYLQRQSIENRLLLIIAMGGDLNFRKKIIRESK